MLSETEQNPTPDPNTAFPVDGQTRSWRHQRKGIISGEVVRVDDTWVTIKLAGDHQLWYGSEASRGRVDADGTTLPFRRTCLTPLREATPPSPAAATPLPPGAAENTHGHVATAPGHPATTDPRADTEERHNAEIERLNADIARVTAQRDQMRDSADYWRARASMADGRLMRLSRLLDEPSEENGPTWRERIEKWPLHDPLITLLDRQTLATSIPTPHGQPEASRA